MDKIFSFANNAFMYIRTMRLADALDILIVAVIIYALIGFIRRTKSIKIAFAVVFLLVALWLSSSLNLAVTNLIVRQVLEIGILAVVVLFQPEIRRALQRVDSSRMFRFFSSAWGGQPIDNIIAQVVDACEDMSASKTGVLIVFERSNKLDDTLVSGTQIDAIVSSQLIKNVFFYKSPLHDGAAIIREGRLAAAGCMLPLSKNPNLSRDLGMRHKAGIGISEQSDAVVVMVSEETGAISVAVDGLLKRHLSPDTFESLLRSELLPDDDAAGKGLVSRLLNREKKVDAEKE